MIEKIKKHDWIVRTLKTFIETFAAVACAAAVDIVQSSSDPAIWMAAAKNAIILPALSAAICAALNIVLHKFRKE